eukprot:s3103_g8.t1
MPRLTKAELILAMAELGEVPPKVWSQVEIAARLDELRMERGLPPLSAPGRKEKTPLRKMVIALNQAAKRKPDLQQFASGTLGLSQFSNDTIPVLQKKCLLKIYQVTEASGEDPVGFGRHSSLTYQEVQIHHPDYATWVISTSKEECDPRLERLANWLQMQQQVKMEVKTEEVPEPIPHALLVEKGYIKSEKTRVKTEGSLRSSASASVTSSQLEQTNQMIEKLAGMMGEMKEELAEMKQERPRKEVKGNVSTNGSFSMIEK